MSESITGNGEWISTKKAAELMQVKVRTVQNLCKQERVDFDCRKLGRDYLVSKSSALAYTKSLGGRPKKE